MAGMADSIITMETPGHPALRFERILNDSTIQDFAQLNCVSYDVAVETSLSLVKEHTLWHEHAYGFVAYEGGKPGSTATRSSTKAASFCSWWQPGPRPPANTMGNPWYDMPCTHPP